MKNQLRLKADISSASTMLDFVQAELKKLKLNDKLIVHTMLLSEEAFVALLQHIKNPDEELSVSVSKKFGSVFVTLSGNGEKFELSENLLKESLLDCDADVCTEDAIRNILMNAYSDDIKYSHFHHRNSIQLFAKKNNHRRAMQMIGMAIIAVILVILFKKVCPTVGNVLTEKVFSPGRDMYLNALKMIATPVVFFSIVCSIMQFGDIKELGKKGGKIIGTYLFTTVCAVLIGMALFCVFQPSQFGQLKDVAIEASTKVEQVLETAKNTDISLSATIKNIIPDNIISPFSDGDMMQIIFLAVLCGAALGKIGRYSAKLKYAFECLNELFLKIATILTVVMPLGLLCIVISLACGSSGSSQGQSSLNAAAGGVLAKIALSIIIGYICMIIVYCLLLLIVGRVNPFIFLKKYAGTMFLTMTTASSSAAMPFNMQACERLGISKKIYSFSIPLGSTINMDGTTVYLTIATLFFARLYGIPLSGGEIFSVFIMIIILSVGAPGIVGATYICLCVLLSQLGIPLEALGLMMGIEAVVGLFRVVLNCTGDVAVSLVVSKSEGLFDIGRFKNMQ